MKKLFILLGVVVASLFSINAHAQSFAMQADTVWFTVTSGSPNIPDTIAPASTAMRVKWNVIATNFPPDWIMSSGFCDNMLCYPNNSLTPSASTKTSGIYQVAGADHDFHLAFNYAAITSSGCYYIKARLMNDPSLADTAYATFVICATAPVGVPCVTRSSEEVSLYPNPASNEINMVYNGFTEIKTAAIYNIIGKTMAVYHINGNSANMSLDNMPGGIYFVRLSDAQGQVVSTRKFTKQ